MKTNTIEKSKFKRLVNALTANDYQQFSHFMKIHSFDKTLATAYEGNDFAFMLIISDKKYHNVFKNHQPEIYEKLMHSIKKPHWKFTNETILNDTHIQRIKDFFGNSSSSAFFGKYIESIWRDKDATDEYMSNLVENHYNPSSKFALLYEIHDRKNGNLSNFVVKYFPKMNDEQCLRITEKLLIKYRKEDRHDLLKSILHTIVKTKGIDFIEKNMQNISHYISPYIFIPFLRQLNINISALPTDIDYRQYKVDYFFMSPQDKEKYKQEILYYVTQQKALQERDNLLIDLDSKNKKKNLMKI